MYRIELSPNEIAAFRTIEEMATAIQSGVITAKARIYHGATDKWLPIEFHPHYKKALEIIAKGKAEERRESAVVVKLKFRPSGEQPAIPAKAPEIVTMAAAEPDPERAAKASLDSEPALVVERGTPTEPAPALVIEHGTPTEPIPALVIQTTAPPEPEPTPAAKQRTREIEFLDLGPDAALRPPAPRPEPLPRGLAQPAPVAVVSGGESPVARRRWRGPRVELSLRPRRPYLIALAGMTLVLVTHVTLPAELPPINLPTVKVPAVKLSGVALPSLGSVRETARPSAPVAEIATHAPAPAVEPIATGPETPKFGGSSVRGSAPAPRPAADTVAAAPAAPNLSASSLARLAAPTLNASSTAGTLADRYASASERLRTELDLGLRNAKFAGIFETKRLETPEGVSAVRTSVATAANYLRTYERRAAELEKAYRDSASSAAGAELRAWKRRRPQEDAAGAGRLVEQLIATIDSLYGILSAQEGKYLISPKEITFTNLAATQEYGVRRRQLLRQLDALDGSPAARTIAVKRLLAAIGGGRMPVEQ